MIRESISNDFLTILLVFLSLYIFLLKRFNFNRFLINARFFKKEFNDKVSLNFFDILFLIFFVINISILTTDYKTNIFNNTDFELKLTSITFFIILKYILEIIIGFIFDFKNLSKNYINLKLLYFNSAGILIFLFNILCVYTNSFRDEIILFSVSLTLLYIIYFHLRLFYLFKKILIKNWFYFILYLCTLEIIPYYFFINNIFI